MVDHELDDRVVVVAYDAEGIPLGEGVEGVDVSVQSPFARCQSVDGSLGAVLLAERVEGDRIDSEPLAADCEVGIVLVAR